MKVRRWVALALVALGFVGCGDTGLVEDPVSEQPPAGTTNTDSVVVGRVASFGSVFVNGIEFDTSKSTFNVRGAGAADPTSLSVGMVVRVKGSHDNAGHGTATDIRYDAEIEGPTSAVTVDAADNTVKRFTVFGQNVLAGATTVFKGEQGTPYTFADLANNQHVEVGGSFSGGLLIATFIERKGAADTIYQAKGTVSQLASSRFTLTLNGGRTLLVSLATGATFPAGVVNGAFVQIQGTIPVTTRPTEFRASAVALQDDDDFDGRAKTEQVGHADLAGVLSLAGTTWNVRGTSLKFSATTDYRPAQLSTAITDKSAAGLRVQVRGAIVDGVLNVDQIRADGRANGAGDLEVSGVVASVSAHLTLPGTTVVVISFPPATGTFAVLVDKNTLLLNDAAGGRGLNALQPGVSFVEVRGHFDSGGSFITGALRIADAPGKYEVSGPVDTGGFVAGASISVLGVKFSVDGSTQLVGGTPANGDFVDVVDTDRNGFAEAVKIEADPTESDFAPP